MKTLIKNINQEKYKSDTFDLNYQIISIDQFIDLIISDKKYQEIQQISISDIKDYNDKEKVILTMFINKYINLNPMVSKYNKYIDYLFEKVNILSFEPILRGFFNAIDLIHDTQIDTSYKNILQIGTLPTFLEAYLYLNHNIIHSDFIQIKSSKYDSNTDNYKLFDSLYMKIQLSHPNININTSLINFYNMSLNDINKQIKTSYDFIIFDTYKNISNINFESYLDEYDSLNLKYLSAIVHSKYIWHQIIFGLNKLNQNGSLILLLPAYEHQIYDQYISILLSVFEDVKLYHSEIDFSLRYFLIGKKYKPNAKLLEKINSQYTIISSNDILISLSTNPNNNKITEPFVKSLDDKFISIQHKLKQINDYFENKILIKKLYYEQYFCQLFESNRWAHNIFELKFINQTIINIIDEYKSYLYSKLISLNQYKFSLDLLDPKLILVGKTVKKNELYQILNCMKYIDLQNLIILDQSFINNHYIQLSDQLNIFHKTRSTKIYDLVKYNNTKILDIISIMNLLDPIGSSRREMYSDIDIFKTDYMSKKVADIKYIDIDYYLKQTSKTNIFENILSNTIISFGLEDIGSFLLSILYTFSIIHSKSYIIKPITSNNLYYFVGSGLSDIKQSKLNKLKTLYDANISNIDTDYYIVKISEEFVDKIKNISSKLIVNNLLHMYRLKFVNYNESFINYYNMILKQTNKLIKIQSEWLDQYIRSS